MGSSGVCCFFFFINCLTYLLLSVFLLFFVVYITLVAYFVLGCRRDKIPPL